MAAEYSVIIPNPPGSSSDTVGRAIADEYTRLTGNTLVFDYVPGADQMIAAVKFKNQSRLTVIVGTSTMHVFNHVCANVFMYILIYACMFVFMYVHMYLCIYVCMYM
jgi:tripartite-type tricarboxylate transporter receptor subunit TctC